MSALHHSATQRAVGHGGFRTASISDDDGRSFTYVYDCGAMKPEYLNPEVDDFLIDIAEGSGFIDLVVISHVDTDHINGLDRLLTANRDVKTRVVALPLLSPLEKLIAVGRSATDLSGFALGLIVDPAATIADLGTGTEVITVAPGEGEPFDGEEREHPFPPLGDPDVGEDFASDFGRHYDKTSPRAHRQGLYDHDERLSRTPSRLGVGILGRTRPETAPRGTRGPHRITDDSRIRIVSPSSTAAWILAPFVTATVSDRRDAFIDALADALAMRREDLEGELHRSLTYVAYLATTHRASLARAYRAVGGTNRSSLCLYSGPEGGVKGGTDVYSTGLGAISYWDDWRRFGPPGSAARPTWAGPLQPATLLTGDADLKAEKRVAELSEHFAPVRDTVGVIHVPHHGSDANFNRRLFADFPNARLALAMVPTTSTKHPGPAAITAAWTEGVLLHNVDTTATSAITTATKITP